MAYIETPYQIGHAMRNRHFQVRLVKDEQKPAPVENTPFVVDLSQITSDDARRAFVVVFGMYASVKLLNTACKVAVVAASR